MFASVTVKELGSGGGTAVGVMVGPSVGVMVGLVVGVMVGPVVGVMVTPPVGLLVGSVVEVGPTTLVEAVTEVGVFDVEVVWVVEEAELVGGAVLPHAINWDPNNKGTITIIPKRCLTLDCGNLPFNQWFKLERSLSI